MLFMPLWFICSKNLRYLAFQCFDYEPSYLVNVILEPRHLCTKLDIRDFIVLLMKPQYYYYVSGNKFLKKVGSRHPKRPKEDSVLICVGRLFQLDYINIEYRNILMVLYDYSFQYSLIIML